MLRQHHTGRNLTGLSLIRDKTRQQLHRKHVTLVAVKYYKKYLSLLESETSLRARLHSAVQCWPWVVRMPWYLWYNGQYLGTSGWTPVRVRWVPRSTQKQLRKETCMRIVY